jgi:PST family polysaccharide transporter
MSIARKAASGAAWNVALSLGTRVISVIATLLVTRYLSPDEYGAVVGSVIVTQTCITLSQMGLTHYVVVKPDAGPLVAFHVTFYTNVACMLALAFVHLTRAWVGPFFNVPELGRYLPWLTATTLAESLSIVPERILYRDLRFRLVALTRAAGDLGFSVASLGLAMAGAGGMALVYAGLLRVLLRSAVYFTRVSPRAWLWPSSLRWSTTREIFAYGLPLSISTVAGARAGRGTTW